jgi:hypothetical protein
MPCAKKYKKKKAFVGKYKVSYFTPYGLEKTKIFNDLAKAKKFEGSFVEKGMFTIAQPKIEAI